jgi:hypothetical protein
MSRELRGRVKQKIWLQPTCTDASEPFRLGQKARRDFKKECQREEGGGAIDVAATDVIDEFLELGDEPLPE